VGLFSKKPTVSVCDMCGKTDAEGCGSLHNHVVEISIDTPGWLPASYRAQAVGEYTWLCLHCSSFPALKWPHPVNAGAGMEIHLGVAHYIGKFKGMGSAMGKVEMIPAR
jgi:hypothetical protein